MRLRENTPERLLLDDAPWGWGALIIGAAVIFAAIGLSAMGEDVWLGLAFLGGAAVWGGAFTLVVRRSLALFDRGEGQVELREISVFGRKSHILALDEVARAVVQTSSSSSSNGTRTRRAALALRSGAVAVPLTLVYSSGSGATRAVEAINGWLGVQG